MGCPVGFYFDGASVAGDVMTEAAPRVVVGMGDQAALDGVSVGIPDYLGAGFTADVSVPVAVLPELFAVAFELAGGGLFEDLDPLVERDLWGFVDEDVDVLGHEDVSVDAGIMPSTGALEDGLDDEFGFGVER
jgi:hypothetical protein